MKRLTNIITLILLGIFAAPANLRAQDTDETRIDQSRIDRAVARLSHPRYVVRQRAEAELLKIGSAARDALDRANKSHDYELRHRAKQLLATLDDRELRRRLRQLIDEATVPDRPEFKAWKTFSEVVGHDRNARELFAAAIEFDTHLMTDAVADHAGALGRYRQLTSNLHDHANPRLDDGALAALLFIAGSESLPWDDEARLALYELWPDANDFTGLLAGRYADQFHKLLARWIELPAPDDCNYQRLLICARHNFHQGLKAALAVLEESDRHDEAMYLALVAVGLFGSRDHVPLLEKHFRNADICDTIAGLDSDLEIQYRDAALASAIRLTGQKLDDYGFTSQLDSEMQIEKHWFANRLDRMRAFRRWQTWNSAQEKSTQP